MHTHTTLAPDTYEALARFDRYADFIRVRSHATRPCCAEMVNGQGVVQRIIEHTAYDAAARLAECDRHGVTMQVISPTPMMIPDYVDDAEDAAAICRILNDGNAALVNAFPTRFTALAALPMRHAAAAIGELERAKSLGMRGVEINSNIDGNDLDEPAYYPIFEAAAAMGMAIFIHPWGGIMAPADARLKRRMDKNWRAWLIGMGTETALAFDALRSGGIHARLPGLRVLYAHGGGVFPSLLGRLEHGPYCRPDLFGKASAMDAYRTVRECGVYVDTLTHDPFALRLAVDTLGVDRIAMGSDYPYPLGELDVIGKKGLYPGYMVEHLPVTRQDMQKAWQAFPWLSPSHATDSRALLCLNEDQKQHILSGTAKEWLAWN